MDDVTIKANVIGKLIFEPDIKSQNINVFVENGIVTLSGKVRTYTEKYLAEQASKNLRGVKAVVEELTVDLESSLQRSDTEIAQAVINSLEWDIALIPAEKIKVFVENGNVELTGEVEECYQKDRATKCIRYLYGIQNISNHIIVKPSQKIVDPSKVSNEIMREFQRNASLDAKAIHVEVSGSKVILKGTVRSWVEQKEARKAARSVKGVTEVEDKLMLSFLC